MTAREASVLADPVEDVHQAADGWLLAISRDQPGRLTLAGASIAQRGAVQGFFHGLLFDRDELAATLSEPAHATDSELAVAAYARWGEDGLARLRGSYAVAIADASRGRTLVARDPLGSHPLFYAESGPSVAFATQPKVLFQQAGVSRAFNAAAMADHLCNRWPDAHETFFAAIRRVPPGWRIVVSGGQVRPERYWDPVTDHDREIDWMSDAEAERFGDVLDRAVRRCLSFGRAGIFLSGGFDSVSIAAVATDEARRAGQDAPVALSLRFADPDCDESDRQVGVATALGLTQRLVDFREAVAPQGLIAGGLALNEDLAFPLFNTWAPAYFELARRGHREGARTILTGSGGDEWLGVSPFLAADLIRRGDARGLVRLARTWNRSYTLSSTQVLANTLWTFGLRPLGGLMFNRIAPKAWERSRVGRLRRSEPAWLAPSAALQAELQARAPHALPPADPAGSFYARESRASLDNQLVSRDLEEQYQFGRRLGVRFMHPYWDADLAAQIYRTRPELLLRGGRTKGLVRDTVARRFPGLGFEYQRKVLALSFFVRMAAAEGPAIAKELGSFPALDQAGVVDGRRAARFVADAFPTRDRDMLMAVHLFNMERWARAQMN